MNALIKKQFEEFNWKILVNDFLQNRANDKGIFRVVSLDD